jgi:hypothetical protein
MDVERGATWRTGRDSRASVLVDRGTAASKDVAEEGGRPRADFSSPSYKVALD